MSKRIGVLQALRLHIAAATTGGSILALGFLVPLLLTVRGAEGLVSLTKFAMAIVLVTLVLSTPFSFLFWLTHNADRTLKKSTAALYGACAAILSFLLLFVIAGEAPRFSGDFMLTFGLLVLAGSGAGLFFRWRLMALTAKLIAKE